MAAVKTRERPITIVWSSRAALRQGRPDLERRARAALLVLVVVAVAIQPIAVQVANYSLRNVYAGTDTHSQWTYYRTHPVPEVLFIGPSNARMDVDVTLLTRILSSRAGRHVSVGKLGISAEQPTFLEALTYRVMNLPSRPRLVVFTVAAAMFNPTFHCPACVSSDLLTLDLWQISEPFDAGFMKLAAALDPRWPWLLTGWVLPAVGYYPQEAAAVQCPVVKAGRHLYRGWQVQPPPVLVQPTACDLGVHPLPDEVMSTQKRAAVNELYLSQFVGNYQFSPVLAERFRHVVSIARKAGARAMLATLPEFGLSDVAPAAHAKFWVGITALTDELSIGHVNLSSALNDQPDLWTDPMHLNLSGAARLAPALAEAIWPEARQ
jgi:hypothetical protein